jgi:hypothetical protein
MNDDIISAEHAASLILRGMELQRDAILQMVEWRLGRLLIKKHSYRVEGLTGTMRELESLQREIKTTPCKPPPSEARP